MVWNVDVWDDFKFNAEEFERERSRRGSESTPATMRQDDFLRARIVLKDGIKLRWDRDVFGIGEVGIGRVDVEGIVVDVEGPVIDLIPTTTNTISRASLIGD